jgi:hypothetical protein
MMRKTCENCGKNFTTKDARQKSCGKACADVSRARNAWRSNTSSKRFAATKPNVANVPRELPLPEELPAPYAKRVYDMWATLVGDGDAPTRIA